MSFLLNPKLRMAYWRTESIAFCTWDGIGLPYKMNKQFMEKLKAKVILQCCFQSQGGSIQAWSSQHILELWWGTHLRKRRHYLRSISPKRHRICFGLLRPGILFLWCCLLWLSAFLARNRVLPTAHFVCCSTLN